MHLPHSSGSSGRVRGGAGNRKSMRPPLVAIFFMTYFHRAGGGGLAPSPPPGSATVTLTGVRMVTRNTVVLTSLFHFGTKTLHTKRKPYHHKLKLHQQNGFSLKKHRPNNCFEHAVGLPGSVQLPLALVPQ